MQQHGSTSDRTEPKPTTAPIKEGTSTPGPLYGRETPTQRWRPQKSGNQTMARIVACRHKGTQNTPKSQRHVCSFRSHIESALQLHCNCSCLVFLTAELTDCCCASEQPCTLWCPCGHAANMGLCFPLHPHHPRDQSRKTDQCAVRSEVLKQSCSLLVPMWMQAPLPGRPPTEGPSPS